VERRRAIARAGVLAGAALAVAAATRKGRGRAVDDALFERLNRGGGQAADRFFGAITELGSIWASAGAATVLTLTGRRRTAAKALAAASATWLLGQGLKRVFLRARPYDTSVGSRLLIGRPRGTTWPSSHPMVLLAFLTVAEEDLGLDRGARAILRALTGAVGFSRVYLGVHYPADVAGGLLLGRAVGLASSAAAGSRR